MKSTKPYNTIFSELKHSISKIYVILAGRNHEFKIEHQLFNFSCLLNIGIFLILLLNSVIFNADSTFFFLQIIIVSSCSVFYYLSRFKHLFHSSSCFYFVLIPISFLILGIKSGGFTGDIMPLYTANLVLMLLITGGNKRKIHMTIWAFCIFCLFVLDQSSSENIIRNESFLYKYYKVPIYYFSGITIIVMVFFAWEKSYLKAKRNDEKMTEKASENRNELKQQSDKIYSLSLREREVCKLLLKGYSNKEIAKKLYIETGTVKSHLNKIYKKLETKNRVELINILNEI